MLNSSLNWAVAPATALFAYDFIFHKLSIIIWNFFVILSYFNLMIIDLIGSNGVTLRCAKLTL